jgi:murein DD-endopeptidase MepM/ murein hydrolase activator NlpD
MRIHLPISRLLNILISIFVLVCLSCASKPPVSPPLTAPVTKPEGIYHKVEKSETLWRICKTYKVNMQEVAELNNIKNTSLIRIGDKIFIPRAKQQLQVNVAPPVTGEAVPEIVLNKGMFIWPVKGKIIKQFGISDGFKNDGIDIAASMGSKVVAAYSGRVVFASELKGYGNTIIIQHNDKYTTIYANNKSNLVKKGASVKTGQLIAMAGNSSGVTSTIPHLHFQIREENQPRNPLFYLP